MTSQKKPLKKISSTKFELWIKRTFVFKAKLAEELGVSQSIISFWCSGRSKPSHRYIMKIWELSKDEIQPNYWFFEWPSEVKELKLSKLKSASIRARNAVLT